MRLVAILIGGSTGQAIPVMRVLTFFLPLRSTRCSGPTEGNTQAGKPISIEERKNDLHIRMALLWSPSSTGRKQDKFVHTRDTPLLPCGGTSTKQPELELLPRVYLRNQGPGFRGESWAAPERHVTLRLPSLTDRLSSTTNIPSRIIDRQQQVERKTNMFQLTRSQQAYTLVSELSGGKVERCPTPLARLTLLNAVDQDGIRSLS